MKNKKKIFLFLAIITIIVIGLQAWDDTEIFTAIRGGKGKSNIVLVQDHTGSMCSIIYHPDFNGKDSTLDNYDSVNLSGYTSEGITQTSWYVRWFIAPTTINEATTYAIGHTFTSTGGDTGTLLVGAEGVNFRVDDWVLQYNSSDVNNINYQAVGRITAISAPNANKFFTLTLADIKGTFVHDYRLYVWASNATLYDYNSGTHVLRISGDVRNYYNINDYILLYDTHDQQNTSRQVIARVTAKSYSNSSRRTSLTLADIIGTINVASNGEDRVYYRRPAETRLVKLYGTALDQESSAYWRTSYGMDGNRYLQWIFGRANATQRQQVTDFSTLGYDVEYNGYLRSTPVSPANAYALNPDNSNSGTTLLAEWNSVWKDIYPNKIANLTSAINNTVTTNIAYTGAKDTFKNYPSGFLIKIDAETMYVTGHTPSTDPLKVGDGTLNVTRAYNNTVAAAHPSDAAIMIYNNSGLGIDESTPLTNLFSSLQHVDEPTGDVDTGWTETKNISGTNKNCYRYKRVFTRIQVAREALCDVITAKNKLFKVADLAADYPSNSTTLTYRNGNPDFLTRIAPFYIKINDPNIPGNDEIMKVTNNDMATTTLTVSTPSAFPHNEDSLIMAYSGARDLVRFGIFKFSSGDPNPATKIVDLNDFGQKYTNGTYKPASYINTTILDVIDKLDANGGTPLGAALAYVWNYFKPNPGSGTADYIITGSDNWDAVDRDTFGTDNKFESIDGVTHPQGSPMEYWCQENCAVIITDGDATGDSVTNYGVFNTANILKTAAAGDIVTDFYKFDFNYNSGPSRWGDTVNDGDEYLTDVAYFLFHQDMFPTKRIVRTGSNWSNTNRIFTTDNPVADNNLYAEAHTDPRMQWPGNQNIKTYTVGLCLTNTVLPKAASNGGGKSFTASNYRDLSEAFINIISTIELSQVPMTYTTYAAPKQSITGGNYGYIAHFIPQNGKSMWEGHLRRFRLGYRGEFPSNIDSLTEKVIIDADGTTETSFKWDAGVILNNRTTARVVLTSKKNGSIWEVKNFMTNDIINTDLGVTFAQVNSVKYFIQNFNKADNDPANSDYKGLYRLGDTYHFNPQLVGYPLIWKANSDFSYKKFYDYYADDDDPDTPANPNARTEVVYAGANDGKLHCFEAQSGSELWSYIPNSQLKKLKLVTDLLNSDGTTTLGEHNYFVDGKSLVKDIKVDNTGDYTDWKTGLFFGMGMGGRSYCALDVTNPTSADLKVLWETEDDAEIVANGNMGLTEAKPVQVEMYGGSTLGNFPAVILAGGYNEAEVQANDPDILIPAWKKREGKALYVLNASTGALIKKFMYGTAGTKTSTIYENSDFLTAMTAAPAVFDSNNDGFADFIYLAESGDYQVAKNHGGAIWKINCYGDPLDWVAQKIYEAPAGQTIFVSPALAYDEDYRVWVMFGTGRRPKPVEHSGSVYTNLTGQFVAFIDDNSGTCKTNADLFLAGSATTVQEGTYTIDNSGTVKKGFYFNFFRPSEIMFEPQPLYVNKQIFFMTFAPMEAVGSTVVGFDPCGGGSSANGSHYIYQFDFSAQGNTFTINNFLNQSGKILGYGPMGDEFIIYKGAGDAGNFKPGSGEDATKHFNLRDPENGMFWKEVKK